MPTLGNKNPKMFLVPGFFGYINKELKNSYLPDLNYLNYNMCFKNNVYIYYLKGRMIGRDEKK